MGSTVVCTASHPVDLDDGRSLAPGESAEDVDLDKGHNQQSVDDGLLTVTQEQRSTRRNRDESKEDN